MLTKEIIETNSIDDISIMGIDSDKKMMCCAVSYIENKITQETYCIIKNGDRKIPTDEFQTLLAEVFSGFESIPNITEVSIGTSQYYMTKKDINKFISDFNCNVFVCKNIEDEPKEETNE